MTTFSVKLSNILGLSFYRYELTSSTYNPTIDTAFTITCKVTDIFGNPINNKQITLYHNGTSVSNQTTNNNGIATWTITPTTWGTHDFNVSNKHIQVDVDGWRTIADDTTYTFLRNKNRGRWELKGWSLPYNKNTDWLNFGTGDYATSIKPKAYVVMINAKGNAYFRVHTDGTVQWRAISDTVPADTTHYGSVEWELA